MRVQAQDTQSEDELNRDTLLESREAISDEGQTEMKTLHVTWFVRTFGPMRKGSLRQSVISLVCCAMGSGMLAFPSNPKVSGLANSIFILIICALLSRFSMYLLMKCAYKFNVDTYTKLVKYTFGDTVERLFQIDVILYTFGSMVGYQVLFCSFVEQVLAFFNVTGIDNYVQYFGGLAYMVLNFPVSMLKDIYSLRYFTHLQILIIIYIMVSIIAYFFVHVHETFDVDKILWFKFDPLIACTFASTFFGFISHQMIFPLRSELKRATFKRMSKIFNRAICMETLVYGLLMCFGYLTYFQNTQNIIVDNYNDIFFTVAKALFAVVLFIQVPLNLNPSRMTVLQLLNKEDSKQAYIWTTVVLQFGSGGLAMVYPKVKSIFGLLGGVFGMIMVIVLPCSIYIALMRREGRKMSEPSMVVTLMVGLLAGAGGFTGAILSQFNS